MWRILRRGAAEGAPLQGQPVLIFSLVISLVLLATVALAPSSSATRQVTGGSGAKGKHKKSGFVPGDVLVRYRSEEVASRQTRTVTLQSAEGRSILIKVERFDGSDI